MSLKELVQNAKSDESQYQISGYFDAKEKANTSWIGLVTALNSDGFPVCDFTQSLKSTVEWKSKKDDGHPRGIKTWHLADGLYKASIMEKKGSDRSTFYFAVVDGKRQDLKTEQIVSILGSQSAESGTEADSTDQIQDENT